MGELDKLVASLSELPVEDAELAVIEYIRSIRYEQDKIVELFTNEGFRAWVEVNARRIIDSSNNKEQTNGTCT